MPRPTTGRKVVTFRADPNWDEFVRLSDELGKSAAGFLREFIAAQLPVLREAVKRSELAKSRKDRK